MIISMKSTARSIQARERETRAIELRKSGMTYRQMAANMGISAMAAYKIVSRVLKRSVEESTESGDELRLLELERLDAMFESNWTAAKGGDLAYQETTLKIMKRRAELLGLDAPKKISAEIKTYSEIDAQIADLLAKYARGRQVSTPLEIDCPSEPIDT